MGLKDLVLPLAVGVVLVYVYRGDESVDPGEVTCDGDPLVFDEKVIVVTGGFRGGLCEGS